VVGNFYLIRKPKNKNRPRVMLMKCFSSMKPLVLLGSLNSHFMVRNTHGETSKLHLYWRGLIGFSLLALGLLCILTPLSVPWSCQPLITGHVVSLYPLPYPKDRLSDLRIFGFNIPPSCLQPSKAG
jgi:hypothetical protein